jgi:hypothetical protein
MRNVAYLYLFKTVILLTASHLCAAHIAGHCISASRLLIVSIKREFGWTLGPVWTLLIRDVSVSFTGIRNPDFTDHSLATLLTNFCLVTELQVQHSLTFCHSSFADIGCI